MASTRRRPSRPYLPSLVRRGLTDESGMFFDGALEMLEWGNLDALSEESPFVGADLHVHTPASSCYKGDRDDSEYLAILRRYREKDIRVVAITDHNTIRGYTKLMAIRDDLDRGKQVVAGLVNKYPQTKGELDSIDAELNLFDELLLIPGVEIDVNPGVHILLLFDPAASLKPVEEFLISAGYTEEVQGVENPTIECKISVDHLLDVADELGATVVAAHVDRDKGAYKALSGRYRAQVFRHPRLRAVSYCDPNTEQHLRDLFKQKQYLRADPPALLKCSDYHGAGEVGGRISYLRLDELTWQEVSNALAAPVGRVSDTARPDLKRIVEQLALSPFALCYPNDKPNNEDIARAACAILNSGPTGLLVFGVRRGQGDSVTVLALDSEAEQALRVRVPEAAADVYPPIGCKVSSIQYGDKFVSVARFMSVSKAPLHYLRDETAYVTDSGGPRLATAPEIAALVQEDVLRQIEGLQKGVIDNARRLANELTVTANATAAYRLAAVIRGSASRRFEEVLTMRIVFVSGVDRDKIVAPSANIGDTGDTVVAVPTAFRLQDAYLRLSAPTADAPDIDMSGLTDPGGGPVKELPSYEGPALLVVSGGGVHYIPNEGTWYVANCDRAWRTFVLELDTDGAISAERKAVITKRIGMWLKSSLTVWFCLSVLGLKNDFPRFDYRGVPLPDGLLGDDHLEVDDIADRILAAEHEYIAWEAEAYSEPSEADGEDDLAEEAEETDWEALAAHTTAHNDVVQRMALAADYAFAEMLGLDRAQMALVYDWLKSRDVYDLGGPLPFDETQPEVQPA